MALKGVSAIGLGYGPIPIEPFMQLPANITLATAVFFGVFLVILGVRGLLYRGKPIGRSGTWGCGFAKPSARMQYTGSSYAASILEFFRPVAPLHEEHPTVKGRFPQKTFYRSHVCDIAELHMGGVVERPVLALFDKLRWIQHGNIHLYIGYILLAIVVLLFFV
jgi:hydrogenase-4 component B